MESTFLNPGQVVRAAHVHEGMHVADFGAGSGFFTRAAAREVGVHGVVWAIDINRELVPRIKNLAEAEGLSNVEVLQGDIEVLEGTHLPKASFDLCILTNVLFSLKNKSECATEVRRILKNGGQVLIIDWTSSHGGLGPHPDHIISATDAQKIFEEHGFALVRPVPAGAYHWGLILKKKAA